MKKAILNLADNTILRSSTIFAAKKKLHYYENCEADCRAYLIDVDEWIEAIEYAIRYMVKKSNERRGDL